MQEKFLESYPKCIVLASLGNLLNEEMLQHEAQMTDRLIQGTQLGRTASMSLCTWAINDMCFAY